MSYSTPTIWLIIALLGLGSWALRFSFLGLLGGRDLPEWVLRHLRYTAVAIIPGLIAPLILFPSVSGGQPEPIRLAAAAVTLAVGIFTRNIFAALICGAATLAAGLYFFA